MLNVLDIHLRKSPAVIAHRGASLSHPGNTLAAFAAAIEAGADAIEFDVRRTLDGALVVHHDPTLEPAGEGRADALSLASCTLEEVRAHGRTVGVEIPTVEEVLGLCARRIAIDVELKEEGYEKDLVSLVARHYEPANAVFKSFRDAAVSAIKRQGTGFLAGLLVGDGRPGPAPTGVRDLFFGARLGILAARLLRCQADFVSPHVSIIRRSFMARMKRDGRPVFVWTVDDPGEALRLAGEGVDAIVTNDPRTIRDALASARNGPPDARP